MLIEFPKKAALVQWPLCELVKRDSSVQVLNFAMYLKIFVIKFFFADSAITQCLVGSHIVLWILLSVSSRSTNFAAKRCMSSFSVKIA